MLLLTMTIIVNVIFVVFVVVVVIIVVALVVWCSSEKGEKIANFFKKRRQFKATFSTSFFQDFVFFSFFLASFFIIFFHLGAPLYVFF